MQVNLIFGKEEGAFKRMDDFKSFSTVFQNNGWITVKILKFGTPQTIAIIVLKIEKFDVTLHKCIQKMLVKW